uniref:Tctex1 domain-containing protein 1 n=1 Tax=Schistocephalus solidus TaxID=70667 RepID=A0A0X3NIK1_SCHSO
MENKTNVASNARRKHASSGEKRKHINRPAQATDDVSSCVPNINIMPAKVATQKTSPKAPPLSILGAVTAQKALQKFLSPSRRLLDLIRRRSSSRLFLTPLGFYRVPIQIAPTFQLQPTKLFKPDRLENFTRDIVHDIVQKHPGYSSHGTLAKTLCNDVRIAIQGIGPKRYKYVVFCVVADNDKQSMLVASMCLWNKNFDDYFSVECVENDLIVSLTVFASYMD